MAPYEYKFIKIPRSPKFVGQKDRLSSDDFKKCEEVIVSEAKNGWRLKQVVIPYKEHFGLFSAKGYEVILEKEVVSNA